MHRRFGDALVYDCAVGGTHRDELVLSGGEKLPGARPTLFFAPTQIKKRTADWGGDGFRQRLAEASAAFNARAGDPAAPWLRIVEGRGHEAIAAAYAAFVDGRVDPRDGHMLHLAAAG